MESVWPRTRRKYVGMYTTATAMVMLTTPGPSMAAKAMARIRPGKE